MNRKLDELKAEIEIQGRLSWTETDHVVQEVNKAKEEGKSGLEDCCVAMKFKFETGHTEETEKAVQDAWIQLDQNKLAENDEFEAQQKNWEEADVVVDMPGAAEHEHEVMEREVPVIRRVQRTAEVPKVEVIDKVRDLSRVRRGQVPNIQSTQKRVEVPRVQFIDMVGDDPTVMQRQAFTIEARDSQDCPRDPRRDSAGELADEVPDATPFRKGDGTKKRRKAEGQDQEVDVEWFSEFVLPSSQPSPERKVFYASMASSDEEPEQEQAEAQGGARRREEDETDTQGPGSDLVQVAPNRGRWLTPPGHDGPGVGQRAARDLLDGRVSGAPGKKTRR